MMQAQRAPDRELLSDTMRTIADFERAANMLHLYRQALTDLGELEDLFEPPEALHVLIDRLTKKVHRLAEEVYDQVEKVREAGPDLLAVLAQRTSCT